MAKRRRKIAVTIVWLHSLLVGCDKHAVSCCLVNITFYMPDIHY